MMATRRIDDELPDWAKTEAEKRRDARPKLRAVEPLDDTRSIGRKDAGPTLPLFGGEPEADENALLRGFDRFWAALPSGLRKANRRGCAAKWARLRIGLYPKLVEDIVAWTRWHAESPKSPWRSKTSKTEFMPLPMTILNQRRWESGIPKSDPTGYGSMPVLKGKPWET